MADNIDKALNGLDLKTDSLPSDWMITLVNPATGEPAENMTVARFSELLANKMIPLLRINELKKGMNLVSFDLAKGESAILQKAYGLCTILHSWSSGTPSVVMVDSYYGSFHHITGRKIENFPFDFEFLGEDDKVKDLKITSKYTGNNGKNTKITFAYQELY